MKRLLLAAALLTFANPVAAEQDCVTWTDFAAEQLHERVTGEILETKIVQTHTELLGNIIMLDAYIKRLERLAHIPVHDLEKDVEQLRANQMGGQR
jgi:hypothetical protein